MLRKETSRLEIVKKDLLSRSLVLRPYPLQYIYMYIPIQFLSSLRAIVAKNVSFKVLIHMAQKWLACVPLGKHLESINK